MDKNWWQATTPEQDPTEVTLLAGQTLSFKYGPMVYSLYLQNTDPIHRTATIVVYRDFDEDAPAEDLLTEPLPEVTMILNPGDTILLGGISLAKVMEIHQGEIKLNLLDS